MQSLADQTRALLRRPRAAGTQLHAWLLGLGGRERMAIGLMVLAILGGLELVWIWPLHQRRLALEQATAQQAQDAATAQGKRQAQLTHEQSQAQHRLEQAKAKLSAKGASLASQGQALGPWLSNRLGALLALHPVELLALRDLGSEPLMPPSEATTVANVGLAPAPDSGQASTGAAQGQLGSAASLHRHRFEVVLSGSPAALAQATDTLSQGMAPLQISVVHLREPSAGPAVQASLTFELLSTQAQWFKL